MEIYRKIEPKNAYAFTAASSFWMGSRRFLISSGMKVLQNVVMRQKPPYVWIGMSPG